jgi:hypothetical protein
MSARTAVPPSEPIAAVSGDGERKYAGNGSASKTPAAIIPSDVIYAAAAKVYRRGRKGSYDLVSADF